jgi:hypothetical protein
MTISCSNALSQIRSMCLKEQRNKGQIMLSTPSKNSVELNYQPEHKTFSRHQTPICVIIPE